MKIIRFLLWLLVVFLIFVLVFSNSIKQNLTTHFYEERAKVLFSLDFEIDDYFKNEPILEKFVSQWYEGLTPEQRLAQLVMPAYDENLSETQIINWINSDLIGGFLLLRSDLEPKNLEMILVQNKLSIPLLVAADAEPSLMKYRFPRSNKVVETSELVTPELIVENSKLVADTLQKYQINLNFAPVYDISKNKSVIGDRSFGSSASEVSKRANLFAKNMKEAQIIPTAKHFPGHGNVRGDTHKSLLVIEDNLSELDSFRSAIKSKIPVMMIGHLAVDGVENFETEGLPATLSPKIMKDLLRKKLNFQGVVITDAMNMGAVNSLENKDLKSLRAGTDIVLMPSDPEALQKKLLEAVRSDRDFALEVEAKVKRVLRLKLAWRLSEQK